MAELTVDDALIAKTTDYVRSYMANYDGSHDFSHIQRVLRMALHIQARTPASSRGIVVLCALLHDVGDAKYLPTGQDGSRLVADVLRSLGAEDALSEKVQAVCLGVSYSAEVRDPARVAALLAAHPELAVVQDADRLDALGAVGIGRTFAYGGAKGRVLADTMDHVDEKLLRLEAMMKTDTGRLLARERTERLRTMRAWWRQETDGIGLDVLPPNLCG
ncbi:hydrolase [Ophiocordyceps camponoti-floridani]|uniref:Hydrolase n=1 Tax=Ophiocordyceps camponoti-floridani TaxID=2030778 RepID=A0A8H4Q9T7_9HYPO|nr:hydrolase [Ophiocordyceps camponoti-floridani]KAF4591784.1 hydrolase [Ophiocordyceps camponoti-floridani]